MSRDKISLTIDPDVLTDVETYQDANEYPSTSRAIEAILRKQLAADTMIIQIDSALQDRFLKTVSQYDDPDAAIADWMKDRCRSKGV